MRTAKKLDERLTLCLDLDTYKELESKANTLGLKISTLSRIIIKNSIKDDSRNKKQIN